MQRVADEWTVDHARLASGGVLRFERDALASEHEPEIAAIAIYPPTARTALAESVDAYLSAHSEVR